jgi:cell division protein ZipA
MGLFHYRPPGKPLRAPPTFSVSSVLKPGSFDIEQMEDTTVPGVALFIKLPGPDDPVAAFEEMLRTARKLADGLDGVVCDETRSTLTGQVINHMRERIAEFSRKQRLRF